MEPAAQETINKLQAELKRYQECLNEARTLFDIEPVEQQDPATFLINFKMFVDEFRVKSEMIELLESGEGIQQLRAENEALRKQLEWIEFKEDPTPFDQIVLVCNRGKPESLTTAMRRYDNEFDGWVWEVHTFGSIDDEDSYECNDDYEFELWKPLPIPPGNNNTKANDE